MESAPLLDRKKTFAINHDDFVLLDDDDYGSARVHKRDGKEKKERKDKEKDKHSKEAKDSNKNAKDAKDKNSKDGNKDTNKKDKHSMDGKVASVPRVVMQPSEGQDFLLHSNPEDLKKYIIQPNIPQSVSDAEEIISRIVKAVNGSSSPKATRIPNFGKKLINPGCFGVIVNSGFVSIVPPGRWTAFSPYSTWAGIFSASDKRIEIETLTIVNVSPGEYGLAFDNGQAVVLSPGRHIRNSRVFQIVETVNVNEPYISHGTIRIVQVPRGCFGKVLLNNQPKLLAEGLHCLCSPVFRYDGIEKKSKSLLEYHTITRFRVKKGEIGKAWYQNEPKFYDQAGIFTMNSPNFQFVGTVSSTQKEIVLGAQKRITVFDGEVGVSYLKGNLRILGPGQHIIQDPYHEFSYFLSTQQQCLPLVKKKGLEKYLVVETKDFVEVGIIADVFFRIADPRKAIREVGNKSLIDSLVHETAIATLCSIIRSSTLQEISQSRHVSAQSEKKHYEAQKDSPHGSAPLFFEKAHDEFLSKLHDEFNELYGLNILNIRIEGFKIIDQELALNLSKQALMTSKTQTELANLKGRSDVMIAEEQRKADLIQISTNARSQQIQTETKAKNEAAQAEARSKAEAMKILAKAEADAIKLKTEAMVDRYERLSKTKLGERLAMMEERRKMVVESLQGVEKVVYLPSDMSKSMGMNPFNLFGYLDDKDKSK